MIHITLIEMGICWENKGGKNMKEYEVMNVDTGRIFHLIMDSLDSLFTFIEQNKLPLSVICEYYNIEKGY